MTREEIHRRQKARVLASVQMAPTRTGKGHNVRQDRYGLIVRGRPAPSR